MSSSSSPTFWSTPSHRHQVSSLISTPSSTSSRSPQDASIASPCSSSPRSQDSIRDPASILHAQLNVLGQPLKSCGKSPRTGFLRSGACVALASDGGRHLVCSVMTAEFLAFTKTRGNDLSSPNEMFGFPGLVPGNRWCLCAARWKEAYDAGLAPPVVIECTNIRALDVIPKDALLQHAVDVPNGSFSQSREFNS